MATCEGNRIPYNHLKDSYCLHVPQELQMHLSTLVNQIKQDYGERSRVDGLFYVSNVIMKNQQEAKLEEKKEQEGKEEEEDEEEEEEEEEEEGSSEDDASDEDCKLIAIKKSSGKKTAKNQFERYPVDPHFILAPSLLERSWRTIKNRSAPGDLAFWSKNRQKLKSQYNADVMNMWSKCRLFIRDSIDAKLNSRSMNPLLSRAQDVEVLSIGDDDPRPLLRGQKGVFVRSGSTPLVGGDVIAPYRSLVRNPNHDPLPPGITQLELDRYCFTGGARRQPLHFSAFDDAHGNFTRYINDYRQNPTPTKVSSLDRARINASIIELYYHGFPWCLVVVAEGKTILPHQELLIDYGPTFFTEPRYLLPPPVYNSLSPPSPPNLSSHFHIPNSASSSSSVELERGSTRPLASTLIMDGDGLRCEGCQRVASSIQARFCIQGCHFQYLHCWQPHCAALLPRDAIACTQCGSEQNGLRRVVP